MKTRMKHTPLIIALFLLCLANSARAQQRQCDASQLSLKGDSCMSIHDSFHAMQFYIASANADTTNINARRKLAACYRKTGNHQACIANLDRIPADSIGHDDMRMYYYSYLSLDNNDKAAYWGEQITKCYPYDSDIVASLASLYNTTNKPERAEQTTKAYITQCDSTNMYVNKEYAYSLYQQLKYDEAIPLYKKLIAQGADNYTSNFILGMCYDGNNDPANAQKHLEKAVEQNGNSSYCLYRLAMAEEGLLMDSLALNHFKRSLETAIPASRLLLTYTKLASLYFAHNRYAEAARAFQLVIAYDSSDKALNYYNAAQMFLAANDLSKADMYLKIFIEKADKPNVDGNTKKLIETARKQLNEKP